MKIKVVFGADEKTMTITREVITVNQYRALVYSALEVNGSEALEVTLFIQKPSCFGSGWFEVDDQMLFSSAWAQKSAAKFQWGRICSILSMLEGLEGIADDVTFQQKSHP